MQPLGDQAVLLHFREESQALRFAAGTNTLLDLPGGPSGVTGALTVPLPAGTTQTTFVVRQAAAGQAARIMTGAPMPATVVSPLTIGSERRRYTYVATVDTASRATSAASAFSRSLRM